MIHLHESLCHPATGRAHWNKNKINKRTQIKKERMTKESHANRLFSKHDPHNAFKNGGIKIHSDITEIRVFMNRTHFRYTSNKNTFWLNIN